MLLLSVLRARVLLALLLLMMLRTRLLSTLVLRTLLAIAIAPGAIRARSAMPRLPRLRQSALRHVDARLRAVRELALDTFAVSIEVVERLAR